MRALRRLLAGRAEPPAWDEPRRPRLVWPGDPKTIYAVGDVHGCYDELVEAERRIVRDAEGVAGEKLIVMLGDYVDRGPRSQDVLDHLLLPPPPGFRRVCVRGNHDDCMLRFLEAPNRRHDWLALGGAATLRGYGPGALDALRPDEAEERARLLRSVVPEEHRAFLDGLPVAVSVRGFVFVHAGIAPGTPLDDQSDRDLMWIREPFLTRGPELPVTVVHGHTPTETASFGPGRIGIDLGAYATGRLAVLRLSGSDVALL